MYKCLCGYCFASYQAFMRHRREGVCLSPSKFKACGLYKNVRQYWSGLVAGHGIEWFDYVFYSLIRPETVGQLNPKHENNLPNEKPKSEAKIVAERRAVIGPYTGQTIEWRNT